MPLSGINQCDISHPGTMFRGKQPESGPGTVSEEPILQQSAHYISAPSCPKPKPRSFPRKGAGNRKLSAGRHARPAAEMRTSPTIVFQYCHAEFVIITAIGAGTRPWSRQKSAS